MKKCKKDPEYFINNLCKIKHPTAGIIPFKLFSYQKKCLKEFKKHKFSIFKKNRQSGISTLCGNFALWYAMFIPNSTILIVSKRDDDAMEFLAKHVRFPYDELPQWVQDLWPADKTEHKIEFSNGSTIKSLTSSEDTLRSNAASLVIIDEAAFIPDMGTMWSGGFSTMQHGGRCIVISTVNGVGNWYWQTWTDAESKLNSFNPIILNWWDMDWQIEYKDPLTGEKRIISPTADIRKCENKEDLDKYGPFWSPWLEEQYRDLTQKGGDAKFRQEILAEFLGTGNTVLNREAIVYVRSTAQDPKHVIETVPYHNIMADIHDTLDFQKRLWIWEEPIKEGKGTRAHRYVIGSDISSGEGIDYGTASVFDVETREQVAELQTKALGDVFARMIDYIGRWYNGAMLVVERNGFGASITQSLHNTLGYQNLYREVRQTKSLKTSYGNYGFYTSPATKPLLNKCLIDLIQPASEGQQIGYVIKSHRLCKEFDTYVHLTPIKTGCEPGVGNFDDLVMACALGLLGCMELSNGGRILMPVNDTSVAPELQVPTKGDQITDRMIQRYGILLPTMGKDLNDNQQMTANKEIANFAKQLISKPPQTLKPISVKKDPFKNK